MKWADWQSVIFLLSLLGTVGYLIDQTFFVKKRYGKMRKEMIEGIVKELKDSDHVLVIKEDHDGPGIVQ